MTFRKDIGDRSGPIVIGQSADFDYFRYAGLAKALKQEGYEVVLVN